LAVPALLLLGLGGAACEGALPEPDFERMLSQRNYHAYEAAPMFADGRAMRQPPAGTVSRARRLGEPAFTAGVVGGRYVDRVQVPIDRPLLERGRDRFDVFCAACHGLLGDGVSEVARRMALRKPPSLVTAPVTAFPPGRVYQVVTEGYGLMPSYGSELPDHDRWAVVAYLGALATSQSIGLDALPAEMRARARRALP
jgi:mono/diheme cytochrome c family protein